MARKKKCTACGKDKSSTDFFSSKNPMYAADKKLNICKQCFVENCTNVVNGELDLDNTKNMMKRLDLPFYLDYLESAKKSVLRQYDNLNDKNILFEGDKILGIYMKYVNSLAQLKNLNYQNSEDDGFIFKNTKFSQKLKKEEQKRQIHQKIQSELNPQGLYCEDISNANDDSFVNSMIGNEPLTYSEKWRGSYTENDLKYLDDYYAGLERDYKIITENHRDYARKIAKASLQMDKAFNDMLCGYPNAEVKYKNAREAFDSLSKSAKFSESTRSVNDVGISSFSKVASMVEAHNWIPEHIPVEKDEIDRMIEYLSTITKSL